MSSILLIESDVILADIYEQALVSWGHRVDRAVSAQQAIMRADAITPDIVILELQLVGHSGIEFLYEFRSYSEWQSIPVIIHSHIPPAEFSANWQLLTDELGVNTYLYKPQTTLKTLKYSLEYQFSEIA